VPAALVSTVVVAVTICVSVAQAAVIRVRGAPDRALSAGHGGMSLEFAQMSVSILAIVIGALC
jgi:hypothetical protein